MLKQILIYSFLIELTLSSFLPMSVKKHNFGSHVCRYYDHEDGIDYVRPCETDNYCQATESQSNGARDRNYLYTCQKYMYIPPNPSTPLKDKGQTCENNSECMRGLSCLTGSGSTKTCGRQCYDNRILLKIDDYYECRYVENKCVYTKDNNFDTYSARNCKVCGKITSEDKTDGNNKHFRILKEADENDPYSQNDGEFVIDKEACSSGTALYFYLDEKIKNEIDSTYSGLNQMYYRCVTIKAVDPANDRFNYTIGTETVYIYDIDEVDFDDEDSYGQSNKKNTLKSLCNQYLMTKIELWNSNKEEYKNYASCKVTDINDDLKRKFYYLNHPEAYILYKDQTEVIEYLIQTAYPDIVPIIPQQEEGAGFLTSKYLLLCLILLFL